LSQARFYLSATSVGNLAIFAGGEVNYTNYNPVFNVDMYNMTSDTWTSSNISTGRIYASAITVGNLAMFAGGAPLGYPPYSHADVNIYDLETKSWSKMTLPLPRSQAAATSIGNQAMFGGGTIEIPNDVPGHITASVNVFTLKSSSDSISSFELFGNSEKLPKVLNK